MLLFFYLSTLKISFYFDQLIIYWCIHRSHICIMLKNCLNLKAILGWFLMNYFQTTIWYRVFFFSLVNRAKKILFQNWYPIWIVSWGVVFSMLSPVCQSINSTWSGWCQWLLKLWTLYLNSLLKVYYVKVFFHRLLFIWIILNFVLVIWFLSFWFFFIRLF